MTTVVRTLPEVFFEFEKYVQQWALSSEQARATKRIGTSMDEINDFHAAIFPRLDEIFNFLNQFPNDPQALPWDVKNLYDLTLSAMEVAAPVDLGWSSPDIEDVFPLERFQFNTY